MNIICNIIVERNEKRILLKRSIEEVMVYVIGGTIIYKNILCGECKLLITGIEYEYTDYRKDINIVTKALTSDVIDDLGYIIDVKRFFKYPKEFISLYSYNIIKSISNYDNSILLLNTLPYNEYSDIIYEFLINTKPITCEKYIKYLLSTQKSFDYKFIELISKMSANFIQNMFKEHKDIIQPLLTNHLRDKFEEKFKTIKFT